jgi:hypothetical protein
LRPELKSFQATQTRQFKPHISIFFKKHFEFLEYAARKAMFRRLRKACKINTDPPSVTRSRKNAQLKPAEAIHDLEWTQKQVQLFLNSYQIPRLNLRLYTFSFCNLNNGRATDCSFKGPFSVYLFEGANAK